MGNTLDTLHSERSTLATEAKGITDAARGQRALTDGEKSRLNVILERVNNIDAELKAHGENEARVAAINAMFGSEKTGAKGFLRPQMKTVTDRIAKKGISASGATLLVPEVALESPVAQGRPALGLFDVLPVVAGTPASFAFLQQKERVNAAAVVAAGDVKPTSRFTLEKEERTLQVVAHLTEPVDEYLLQDTEGLSRFLSDELAWGLWSAIARQVLYGTGAGELHGIANGSGVQVKPYAVSAARTIRSAMTSLETSGHVPSGIVMSPATWEGIETATTTDGAFIMSNAGTGSNVPLDAARRTLWGVPVAVDPQCADSDAFVLSEGSLALHVDEGVRLNVAQPGDTFTRNQLVARLEVRAETALYRPLGIVKATVKAA